MPRPSAHASSRSSASALAPMSVARSLPTSDPAGSVQEGQKREGASVLLCSAPVGWAHRCCCIWRTAGVGRLGIVDFDVVDTSNLATRQVIHRHQLGGQTQDRIAPSTASLRSPHCQVDLYTETALTSDNALEIIAPYEFVCGRHRPFPTRLSGPRTPALLWASPNVYGRSFASRSGHGVQLQEGPNYRDLFSEPPPARIGASLPRKAGWWGFCRHHRMIPGDGNGEASSPASHHREVVVCCSLMP